MSQLSAEGPTHPSSKATVGGLIKSALVYALVSVIPPAKQGVTVPAPEEPVRRRATRHRRDRAT